MKMKSVRNLEEKGRYDDQENSSFLLISFLFKTLKSRGKSQVFMSENPKERRQALSELYTEILTDRKNITADLNRQQIFQPVSNRVSSQPSPIMPNLRPPVVSSSVRLSSEALPMQQTEPDTTDDEGSAVKTHPRSSFPNYSLAELRPFSADEGVADFLEETKKFGPTIDTTYTSNPLYEEIEKETSILQDQLRNLLQVHKSKIHLVNFRDTVVNSIQNRLTEEQISGLKSCKEARDIVRENVSLFYQLLAQEEQLIAYNQSLFKQLQSFSEQHEQTMKKYEEYTSQCRQYRSIQIQSYEEALSWKSDVESLQRLEIVSIIFQLIFNWTNHNP